MAATVSLVDARGAIHHGQRWAFVGIIEKKKKTKKTLQASIFSVFLGDTAVYCCIGWDAASLVEALRVSAQALSDGVPGGHTASRSWRRRQLTADRIGISQLLHMIT